MQPHKQTVPNVNQARLAGFLGASLLALGCSPTPAPDDDGPDDVEVPDVPDVPVDLPAESSEFAGILRGLGYGAEPSHFVLCDTGELVELAPSAYPDTVWKGSCYGVYRRMRGKIDRDFDPPRLLYDELLEARWCEPEDCGGGCVPDFLSCYEEHDITGTCDPLLDNNVQGCSNTSRCNPERFYATEAAGWMHYVCSSALGEGVAGDDCEYGAPPNEHIDTCAHGYRCWNPAGDTTEPGTCVAYCDVAGELGPTCDDFCVPCSATERGLCLSGCVGEDCRVDDFC